LLTVVSIGGLALWSGPPPMRAPWDVFILLDGGYRIMEGQVPSTDFYSPIGPLVYEIVSLGMRMETQPSLRAVTIGALIFLAIATALAWVVARARLPAPFAAGFTVLIAILVVADRPLGYRPSITSYAMLYNRWSWVLYAIVLVLVLVRPAGPVANHRPAVDGAILGLLSALLFYCKINFFVGAAGAIVVGLALGTLRRRARLGLWAVGTFLGVVIVMWAAFGVRVASYLGDVAEAGRAQGAQRMSSFVSELVHNLPFTLLVAVVFGGVIFVARRRGESTRKLRQVTIAAAYILGSSVFVASLNTLERADLPALAVIPLLLVAYRPVWPAWLRRPLLFSVAVLLLPTAGFVGVKDVASLAEAAYARSKGPDLATSQQIASVHLRDFDVPADSTWQTAYRPANDVPEMINNGIAMLDKHAGAHDPVAAVALTDPFAFATDRQPAPGALWWDVGISFSAASHPDPDVAFGSTRWVMIPRVNPGEGCCTETVTAMLDIYGPYLQQHFTEVDRSTDWILLGRTA